MKEYTYEVQHSWEKQQRPIVPDHQHRHRHRHRYVTRDDAAIDADASSMSGKYMRLFLVASFSVYLKLRNKKDAQSIY